MNTLDIIEPRWRDRVVLLADHKLQKDNLVSIRHKDFPEPYYLSARQARLFPLEQLKTKTGGNMPVRAIPLDELSKEVVDV